MLGRSVLAALLLATAPSFAEESQVSDTLREFGLLGTWAVDCARPASAANEYSIYAVSAAGEATLAYARGKPYRDIVYAIGTAQPVAEDRIALQVLRLPEKIAVDIVLRKESGTIRVWSSHSSGGRMLVIDGVITGNGAESPRFRRWGP